LDTLSGKRYFSFLDGYSGYNQILIAPKDHDKTNFTCPWGTYAYRVLPFRLCNSPTIFQREVLGIFVDLIHDCVEVYMDDFTVYGNTYQESLDNLNKLLIICQEMNLSLSHEKCKMLLTEGVVLGNHVSSEGIKVDPAKFEVIVKLPPPKTQKEVRIFLGHARYYQRFIENFKNIVAQMFRFLTKDIDFFWTDQCQTTFETLKDKLYAAPVLRGPNWALPFHISTDASDIPIGGLLGQKEDQQSYAIYFVSKNLSPTELNYTITENEFLVVVHAINKFFHYIIGYEVFVHTDHFAIRFLMNKPITNCRVTRWLMLLQEFNITILDLLGKENLVADFISRINHEGDSIFVDDIFPDEYLFSISINTPFFADMENYLATIKLPSHSSPHEKRRIIM
jgi:hypothetical protein